MKNRFIQRIGILCILSLLVTGAVGAITVQAANTAYQNGPDIYGDAYCVLDADTGDIICGKDAMGMYHPASITKIMTALVVLEQVDDLQATLTFSDEAVNGISTHSSTLAPKAMVGEEMTVWDCLNGMMLASGNECAAALAEYTAGSIEAFAELMNERAEEIGTTNTHFVNPHGLDNLEHYTNPYDMALIFREALQNDKFLELDSSKTYTIPATNMCAERQLTMGHQIVCGAISYEGVYAGKTGRTALAGRTLATAAEHNGHNIIIIVMHSNEEYFYIDTEILLDYTYALLDGQQPWGWTDCAEEMVATGNVNLREKASEYATVRGSLLAGQKVQCTGRYADWSRVVVDGRTYYVSSSWLQYPDGEPSPTTSTTEAEPTPLETEGQTTEVATRAAAASDEPSVPALTAEGGNEQGGQVVVSQKSGMQDFLLLAICCSTIIAAGAVLIVIWKRKRRRRVRRYKWH